MLKILLLKRCINYPLQAFLTLTLPLRIHRAERLCHYRDGDNCRGCIVQMHHGSKHQEGKQARQSDAINCGRHAVCNVRFGSRTTDLPCPRNVRFSPESDQIAALRQVTFRDTERSFVKGECAAAQRAAPLFAKRND